MRGNRSRAKIEHVLCPSDLSEKSQNALGFAARLCETLGATLTACHCSPASWFTQGNRLSDEQKNLIKTSIRDRVTHCQEKSSKLTWKSLVIENSFDPARDILTYARKADVDLMVMKARPGVLSAFRFGSIVERVVEGAQCPTLLLPSHFLSDRDATDGLEFRRILFDYDFSEATDHLFKVANTLTRDCHADLHVLTVLEPTPYTSVEAAPLPFTRTTVQTTVREKIDDALHSEGKSVMEVPTVVEWGRHAETVLRYAKAHDIDLICTALAPPHFYYEKLYSSYLGSLLRSAECPILVKRAVGVGKVGDLS